MGKKYEQKIFLDNLPKWTDGRFVGKINWKKSIGCKVDFIYDDIEGVIEIIDFIQSKHSRLIIKYNDNEYNIGVENFQRYQLGKVIGKISGGFKIEIGTRFQDENRDITIIDRRVVSRNNEDGTWKCNDKYYKYECNRCSFDGGKNWNIKDEEHKEELWTEESNLLKGVGCSCCCQSPQIVVQGINDIPTTTPWLIPYFQGGYEEARKYCCNSNQKIYAICPDCRQIKSKKMSICKIYNRHSIGCSCADNISFGEKLMLSVLKQINVNFKTQLNKSDCIWCEKFKYDFYFKLNKDEYIIETHGRQHYENAWSKLEKTQENDKHKKQLALKNGIKDENYIVIDCRKSELEFIKENIFKSQLIKLFDLSNIDWGKAEEFTTTNLVKMVCEYKRNNPNITSTEIAKKMKMSKSPIIKYLNIGNKQGWCNYDGKDEMIKNGKAKGGWNSKEVLMIKDNTLVGKFKSGTELERLSENLFGLKLRQNCISKSCLSKNKYEYNGYIFKYLSDLTPEELEKYQQKINQAV